ncbi:MAG TPA: DUF4294 domain-containing protein [Bacteroidia bacterium]|nr:DUF4294 domain-containing protein [Bacteroidia bacterium]
MKRPILFLLALFLIMIVQVSFAQTDSTLNTKIPPQNTNKKKGFIVQSIVYNGDTIPYVELNAFYVVANRVFSDPAQAALYWRLERDVKIVYPYAVLASVKLKSYDNQLAGMHSEVERKLFMKQAEIELKAQFGDQLKDLTITQGRILIRLIDRETGNTSYALVKELRGSFSAFMWQSLATLFGSNLKSEYNPQKGEDQMIEQIIGLVESGQL